MQKGPGRRLALIAALVGAAALLAGAGWFAVQAITASDGAESPEAAADSLIEAVGNEDFLTMAELLEPGERRAVAEPILFEIVPELQRLGVLGDDFDSSRTEGLDIELTDVTYRVDRPADSPDVAFVYFTGGTSTVSLDVDRFPFGNRVRDEIDQDPSIADELGRPETEELASDSPLVMVERDGRWYVSMVYTVMESAFPGELPATVAGLSPVGADSPEGAVEAMLQSALDLDLRSLIQRFEPGEMHALHRYAPLFIDDAQRSLDEFSDSLTAEGIILRLSDLDLERERIDERTVVEIRGFVLDIEGGSAGRGRIEYGQQRMAMELTSIDGAFDLDVEATPTSLVVDGVIEGEVVRIDVIGSADRTSWTLDGRVGPETITASIELDEGDCWPYVIDDGTGPVEGCALDDLGSNRFALDDLPAEFPGLPVVVAETDGQWYVSPIGSMMHGVVQRLRDLDESDLEDWMEDGIVPGDLGALGLGDLDMDGTGGGMDDFGMPPEETTTLEAELVVPVGATVTERQTLGPAEQHRWTVELADGHALAVTLESDGPSGMADPVLDVYENGLIIGSNDDYESLNSALRLTGPGTFELAVRELAGDGGDYLLTVEAAADLESLVLAPGASIVGPFGLEREPVESVEDVEIVDLSAGPVVIAGSVADNAYDEYVVTGTGQPIVIELLPGADTLLDPYLVVRDELGAEVASNDDDPSGELPFLSSRIVLDGPSGTLTIEARSLSNLAGDYEIRISQG